MYRGTEHTKLLDNYKTSHRLNLKTIKEAPLVRNIAAKQKPVDLPKWKRFAELTEKTYKIKVCLENRMQIEMGGESFITWVKYRYDVYGKHKDIRQLLTENLLDMNKENLDYALGAFIFKVRKDIRQLLTEKLLDMNRGNQRKRRRLQEKHFVRNYRRYSTLLTKEWKRHAQAWRDL